MLFTSYGFIGFFLICFLLYYLIPKQFQWVLLLLVSYFFYAQGGMWYPLFLLLTTSTVYLTALRLEQIGQEEDTYLKLHKLGREDKKAYKKNIKNRMKRWMLICLLMNLAILAVLKYADFAVENINQCLYLIGSAREITYPDFILPVGISFYTFQALGYLLDVYWRRIHAQPNFFKFALFLSFFPQLSQGPISRYQDLSQTLYEQHSADWKNIRFGLERILWGYFKKLVIADRIYIAVSYITEDPEYYTGAFVFVGMVFYAIQLYADFTGGIDITIGIAQVFGIRIKENFERPFFAKNIEEYWRRWHISMGTWFRDYIFYPLSLSKPLKNLTTFTKNHFGLKAGKRSAIYVATMTVWLATGIWHGAGWNYITWGLMNGVIILISQELTPLYEGFHKRLPGLQENRAYAGFQVLRTFLLMSSLRLFDNYQDVRTAFRTFLHMFTQFDLSMLNAEEFLYLDLTAMDYAILAVGVALMLLVSLIQRTGSVREYIAAKPYPVKYLIFVLLFFSVILFGAYGIDYDSSQFIYNQF